MANIIFLGAPGSGKGTQAAMVAKKLNIPAISTGDALRAEVAAQSEIGKKAKSCMESGQLVSDEIVIGIIKNRISKSDCDKGFILDGFPRNISQGTALEEMLSSLDKKLDLVFNFDIEEDILVKRICGRFSCKNCKTLYNKFFKAPKNEGVCDECGSKEFESRSDDNEATVKSRLEVYHESTFDLIEYYQKKDLLVSINAVKQPTLVFDDLIQAINNSKN